MTARRKRLVGVAALCVVLAGLAGCQYWYKDMKGYLEYWSSTVTVGNLTWKSSPDYQRNSSGMYTIPTNAVVSVTASIENPDSYPLDSGVGSAQDTLRSVRTAGAIGGTVRVTKASPTSIELELTPFSSVPTPESRLLEHRDFTVTIVPTRTDSGLQAANPQDLTLRYNTPPRMPVEVVENNGQLEFLGPTPWQLVQQSSTSSLNGKIYWAWPKGITDPTDPDCAARFRVYQKDSQGTVVKEEKAASDFLLDTVDPSLLSYATAVTDAGYKVYAASVTAGNEITIEAVDGEGVVSQGTVSGRSPVKITLNANGGSFKHGTQPAEVYKAVGSRVSGSDFETPQQVGSVLTGWSESVGGPLVSFPYEIAGEKTLYAQWRSDWTEYLSTLGPGERTVSITTTLTEGDVYALRAAIAASPDTKVRLDLSGATFPGNTLPAQAFNGENTAQGEIPNLVEVVLPASLTGIGEYAFNQCTGLAKVNIPSGVQSIGEQAFRYCTSLTSVTIPNSVQIIGNRAFAYSNLTSVDIPGSVETIDEGAFLNCTSLASVTLGEGVRSIGQAAFQRAALTSITIPGSVETIGDKAFLNCTSLASVTIGEGVRSIGDSAFANCGLTSITIPGSVETIGDKAFLNCTSLASVTIGEGVRSIGLAAFQRAAFTSITIPRSMQSIGERAFVSSALNTVNYPGSQSEWSQISIHSTNQALNNATKNFDYVGP